jgi:class 3 adenylate cyclase/tetratricopeptide (TPR) repeat protein
MGAVLVVPDYFAGTGGSPCSELDPNALLRGVKRINAPHSHAPESQRIRVAFVPTCPFCGEENSERARFCQSCGTSLAPAAGREARKTVTVLFIDVVGSTRLGERLDTETLTRLMSQYFEAMKAVIERHGGQVAKFIGDAVLGVFGAPISHEDDALRAVRAASDSRRELRALNEKLADRWAVRLETRTAVNTGEVLVGPLGPDRGIAIGDAMNLAARLEEHAQPGEILLGQATDALVRHAVEAEPLEPLSLRGKAEPVHAWRLLRVLPTAEAIPRRLESPMVGRRDHLAILELAFRRAVEDRTPWEVTVVGPAGVGKSRLVEEFLKSMKEQSTVLLGRCLPYGEGITYWPIAEMVKQAANIAEGDSAEEARSKIVALLPGNGDAEQVADRVAGLIGLSEVEAAEEGFWAVRRLFEALATPRPLIVVLDDLQWGEPTLLDLIEHVAARSRGIPLLLLTMARPELFDDRPAWDQGRANRSLIRLEPLTDLESQLLMENLLGRARLPEGLERRITEAAEGFPLFIEQMLSMLVDKGMLRHEDGGWAPAAELEGLDVPATLQALLVARLDRLGEDERAVLERASVVGELFYWEAVTELAPERIRSDVGSHLMDLVRKELIRPERSDFAGQEAFKFRHILIRDVCYGGIPKQQRAELHEWLADWLERVAGGRVGEYEEILGYHVEQAYRYRMELEPTSDRLPALRRRAAELLAAAGLRASAREDYHGAESLLSRCTELWPQEDSQGRVRALLGLADLLLATGQFLRAENTLAEVTRIARHVGDGGLEVRTELRRIYLRAMVDPSMAAEDGLRRAEEAAEALAEFGDEAGLAEAWARIEFFRHGLGRHLEGEMARDRARVFASSSPDPWLDRRSGMSWALPWTGTGPRPASEEAARARDVVGHAERRTDQAYALLSLALHVGMQGEFQAAQRYVDRASAIVEDLGLRVGVAQGRLVRAQVEMLAGDPAAAERALRPGIEILEVIGSTGQLSTWVAFMARILYEQGRHDEALESAQLAEHLGAAGDMETQLRFPGIRAKVLARTGAAEEAERLAREVVQMAEGTDWLNFQGDAFMDLAEVLQLTGQPEEAAGALRAAVERYEAKGNVASSGTARALLDDLRTGEQSTQ